MSEDDESSRSALDPQLLRSFLTVCDSGGFTAAAVLLHLTQSTVSHQIRRLESLLGTRLFQRSTRRIALTEAGEQLRRDAQPILAELDALLARHRHSPLSGTLRFAAQEDYFSLPLADLLPRFAQRYPEVNLDVQVGLGDDLLPRVQSGAVDLALIRQVPPTGDGHAVWREPLVWACSTRFAHPHDGGLPLALAPAPCAYRQAALHALEASRQRWRVVFSCRSRAGLIASVASGLAISPLRRGELGGELREVDDALGLPPLPEVEMALHSAKISDNPAAATFAEMLAETLATAHESRR